MSGFLPPPAKIALLERRLNSLEALLRRVITSDGQVRLDGTTLVGVLPPHGHEGVGEGGTIDTLADDDADTYVKVEVTADSDVIESATAATIRSRLSVLGSQYGNGTDALFYSDGFTTLEGGIDGATGHIGVGIAPSVTSGLLHSETIIAAGVALASVNAAPTVDLNAANASTIRSFSTALTVRSDGVARTQSGIVANVHAQGTIGGGGLELLTVNDWRHFDALFAINANNTVTDRYGVRIRDATGGGTLVNQYAFYAENMDSATTINRVIQSLGGISTHLGAWSMGSNTAPGTGDILTLTAGHLSLLNNNELKLWDSGSSNFISIRSNAARTTDLIYVLPSADPTVGQVLSASAPVAGVVTLSWASTGASAWPTVTADTTLTIASGAITVTQDHHIIETEAAAASDDLVTINGLTTDRLYLLRPANAARTVVLKHGTGNIFMAHSAADMTLDEIADWVLGYSPDGTNIYILGGGGGGGVSAHALLDGGTAHSDTAVDTVSRGSIIYGNSTPAWDEFVLAADRKVFTSDGTDLIQEYVITSGVYASRPAAATAMIGRLYMATDRNNTLYRCTNATTWAIVNPRRIRLEWYFDGKIGLNNAARQGMIKRLPDDMGTWLPVRAWAQVATAPSEAAGTIAGTADSGSTTTLVDSATSWTAKQFIGAVLTMTSGSQNGKKGLITDNTTTVLTVGTAFAGAIATGDTYTIASGIRIQFEYGASDTPSTNLFTEPASDATADNRLTIAVAGTVGTGTTFIPTSIASDSRLEMMVDGIGAAITGVHGIDLSVMLELVVTDG